jgi:ferrous iron transport protein A
MTGHSVIARTLSSLAPGESGVIARLDTSGAVLYKLMELGLWPGETVRLVRRAPLGDPLIVSLMSYHLALRKSEAERIFLE